MIHQAIVVLVDATLVQGTKWTEDALEPHTPYLWLKLW